MKTLDEVIRVIEDGKAQTIGCDSCVCHPDSCQYECDLVDSLLYLKMYRSDKLQWEREKDDMQSRYQEAIDNCERAENKFKMALKKLDVGTLNEPLTWDELKQMEGKPVWIELLGKGKWKGWDIIGGFDDDDFGFATCTVRGDDYYLADLEKTWQAYRKERK